MNKLCTLILLLFLSLFAAGAPCALAAATHATHGSGEMAMGAPAETGLPVFSREEALARSRAALGGTVGNHEFVDSAGNRVRLHDFLGKPLLVSLIYTSCYHICPTTTRHLHEVVERSRGALGQESFVVLTVGFDSARDTPAMMAHFAHQQGVDSDGWSFLSGTPESVHGLASDLGFTFQPSPNGFDHLIQTSVITPEGEVLRHIYGMDFEAPLVIEPLKYLLFGDEEEDLTTYVTDRIRLFCTVYDPARGRYRFDYSIFIGTFIAFLCVGLLGWQLIREWRVHLRAASNRAPRAND